MTLEERWTLAQREMDIAITGLEQLGARCGRLELIAQNSRQVLDEFDEEFCRKTRLTGLDWTLVIFATALQIARQWLTAFKERQSDQDAANDTWGHGEEHSWRRHRYYEPTMAEIISNPVPFDANLGSKGALAGAGRLGHRATALGHDPVLGLIIGTANIATSTLTTNKLASYHIRTIGGRDCFAERASTSLVLEKTAEKILRGYDGIAIVGASLIKEIVHLRSDINSKNSLPLPCVAAFDAKLASELASYGLDMMNVMSIGNQAGLAIVVNTLVSMVHRALWNGDGNTKLYEVRTRKIIDYSNVIAQSVNLGYTYLVGNYQKLDVGGLAVCLWRLVHDIEYIRRVKREFIFGEYKRFVEEV